MEIAHFSHPFSRSLAMYSLVDSSRLRRGGRRIVTYATLGSFRPFLARFWPALFLTLLTLLQQPAAGFAASNQDAPVCRTHFAVLYDFSWRALEPSSRPIAANQLLAQSLFGPGQAVPAWTPGDCLSFYSFGMDRQELEAQLSNATPAQFWSQWKRALLHPGTGSPLQTSDNARARAFLAQNLPSPLTHAYLHSLSYYALPTLIASWPPVYASTTYIVWVSDFLPDNDQLREIDEGLVRSRLGTHSGTLERLRGEYGEWEKRLRIVFRSTDELHGLRLTVLLVNPPALSWDSPHSARLVQVSASGWRQELPAWPLLPSDWRCDSLDLELIDQAAGHILARWSVNPAEAGTLALQLKPETEASGGEIPYLELSGIARLRFAPRGSLGLELYTFSNLRQIPVTVSPLPPLWYRWTRILFVLLLLLVSLLLATLGRKPRWDLRIETAGLPIKPESFQAGGHPIDVLPWAKDRIYRIRLRVTNTSDRLNLRRPTPILRLEAHAPLGSGIEFRLKAQNTTRRPGEPIQLPPLQAGAFIDASVLVDLSHQPEPTTTSGPFEFAVQLAKHKEAWPFALAPDPGNFWLGLDPGTSGACIAGGSNPDDFELVPLRHAQVTEEDRCVVPSLVYLCINEKEAEAATPSALRFQLAGRPIRYFAGDQAASRATLPEAPSRLFRSAKRLIGYRNPFNPEFEGKPVHMYGQDAVAMLAEFLVVQAGTYFQRRQPQGQSLRINKLVVAVPNMFTPGKIRRMSNCCQVQGITRVLTIYEAEAVLVYYWWCTARLHPKPETPQQLRSNSGEFVLIMDFGGGGANFTYARIEQRADNEDETHQGTSLGGGARTKGREPGRNGEKTHLHIHTLQRIGYAIGGDHIDWEVARLLWRGIKLKGGINPYAPPAGVDPRLTRNSLLSTAAQVKIRLSQYWTEKRGNQGYTFPEEEFKDWKGEKGEVLSAEFLLADQGIETRIKELEAGIEELKDLCKKRGCWKPVDTLIFSGRSTRFPQLKERIVAKLSDLDSGHRPTIIDLDHNHEAKTCVARGAAVWGMQQACVHLHSDRTFAHYGVVRHQPGGAVFDSLIPAGEPFQNGVCKSRPFFGRYPYNNNELVLLQVMASKPESVVRESTAYTRRSILGTVGIDSSQNVDRISLSLDQRDNFYFEVEQRQGGLNDHASGDFQLDDIRKDGDPSAEWLLDVPDGQALRDGSTGR